MEASFPIAISLLIQVECTNTKRRSTPRSHINAVCPMPTLTAFVLACSELRDLKDEFERKRLFGDSKTDAATAGGPLLRYPFFGPLAQPMLCCGVEY
jgi:hypothetical protein